MFDILFLGTGAADGINLDFPMNFENKNLRRCASVLLDGKILIDCGPHVINSLETAKINAENITDVFITHFHADHFDLDSFEKLLSANNKLKLWCSEDAVFEKTPNCKINKMTPFTEYIAGEISVTGLPANHDKFAQHFSFEKNGKKLLYALDGAWFLGESVEFMKQKQYKAVVLDATVGDYVGDYRMGEHNSIPMIRLMVESMKTLDIIDAKTKLVLSHMAMCLHKNFVETEACVEKDGFIVAFDGMKLEV